MKKSWKLIPIVALAIGLVIPVSAPAAEDKEAFFPATLQTDGLSGMGKPHIRCGAFSFC